MSFQKSSQCVFKSNNQNGNLQAKSNIWNLLDYLIIIWLSPSTWNRKHMSPCNHDSTMIRKYIAPCEFCCISAELYRSERGSYTNTSLKQSVAVGVSRWVHLQHISWLRLEWRDTNNKQCLLNIVNFFICLMYMVILNAETTILNSLPDFRLIAPLLYRPSQLKP